jgi:fructokinase
MNDEELEIIYGWFKNDKTVEIENQMTFIMKKFDIGTLVMTQGKDGAYCMNKDDFYQQKSFPVQLTDTVGSGDSFLAAFLYKMSNGDSWNDCLEFACATGALVATKSGGTPDINENMVLDFIKERLL